ncbi:acyl-CoA-binding protein (ACBP)/diazepam binding inhibitor (DBI)/endozepine (EP) [Recurvomyces mirabilis]|uniref:Acyl-CoA-binding protein (ACBP)/diazepam binding inhibitor (DBI)/endozepine (EP) n=1 Tax=Recurvomyces mirabilis TaxID=574656 RepID=A0AAE0WUY4_9PEZI|nr:acyl-CoA-binding protein (ACBP)/diazepam binding inhibitor (DBI)/endozepine (EP) [Recurvomyces mirabilis]KAK5150217.1 acyl-CoA-binding protein (ACBP)/diazepam binding inhibitor (DBI)/endozepine (EP) [Recurvomyces mirabilis]
MPATQTPDFKKAVIESRKLKAKPTDNELLELYGLFKQGSQDPPFADTTAPGMFELKEKAKRSAWEKLVKEDVKPADAQKRYVKLVGELKTKHGFSG